MKCAYNSARYPRTSIFESDNGSRPCYEKHATAAVKEAVQSLGKYHKYMIEKKLRWGDEES